MLEITHKKDKCTFVTLKHLCVRASDMIKRWAMCTLVAKTEARERRLIQN